MWISTASTEDDQHHCQFSPAYWFACSVYKRQTCKSTQKPNDKDGSEDNKTLCSAEWWQNSVCIAFLLIPTLGKSGLTSRLVKVKFQTASVRTLSFLDFILPWICLQTRHSSILPKILLIYFIIKLMQYKDTSQQALLISYLICILSIDLLLTW